MRNIAVRFSLSFTPVALAVGLVLAACGSSESTSAFRAGDTAAEGPGVITGGDSFNGGSSDAGKDEKPSYRGSPLCGAAEGECSPDVAGCSKAPSDDPDAAPPTDSCRLHKDGDDNAARVHVLRAPRGVDGVSCQSGSDCAPGFDCVDGAKGAVCRRYCCLGSCATHPAQNGGPTFCDIQKLVDAHMAPVCMPLKTCKPLVSGECGDKETCAVVNEKGETGCVPTGNAKAGDSCDKVHCDASLTCLGSPGDRRCYKLCRVEGSDCGPMQTCTTGSVFQDTTFGVCKDD